MLLIFQFTETFMGAEMPPLLNKELNLQ